MGVNVQVCWEKFCNFWEVEPRLVPMEGDRFHLDPQAAAELCDENTIGVVGILGSTFDGSYEPIAELCAALDALQERTGLDIPVHVDGASGAMVAPFLDEDLVWDFRLPRVASINTSGHKYGLVYPGVGWALWRDTEALPEELVFRVNYLGGDMPTFALNFSRPGAQVVAQYYTFLRLGREGYRAVQQSTRDVARRLAERVEALGDFRLLTRGDELPVFAFTTAPGVEAYDVFDVSRRLRERGWLVPAYTFPPNREDLSVLRVVCRNGFSADLADLFVEDLEPAAARTAPAVTPVDPGQGRGDRLPPLRPPRLLAQRAEPPYRQRKEHRQQCQRPRDGGPHLPRRAALRAEQVPYRRRRLGHGVPLDDRAQPARHGVGGRQRVGEEADRPDQDLHGLHQLRLAGDHRQVDADPQHGEPEEQEQPHGAEEARRRRRAAASRCAYPTPIITARLSADWSMSAAERPTRTAPLAIGMERKRSITPLLRSWVTASMVPPGRTPWSARASRGPG